MVCSKETKPTASQVAIIATYMQPVKLCRIILYKFRSVFLEQLIIMLYHSLLKRTPPYVNMN